MATTAVPFPQLVNQCEAEGLTPVNCAKIAAEVARTFNVFEDEVAIMAVMNGAYLKFKYPPKLADVGSLPLSNSGSIAVRTVVSKRPEVLNNFTQVKHASIFEAVPIASKARSMQSKAKAANMIQKIMSAPVAGPSGVLGVIQVSRKGTSPQAAGADFTPADLQKLVTFANLLVKCFK